MRGASGGSGQTAEKAPSGLFKKEFVDPVVTQPISVAAIDKFNKTGKYEERLLFNGLTVVRHREPDKTTGPLCFIMDSVL